MSLRSVPLLLLAPQPPLGSPLIGEISIGIGGTRGRPTAIAVDGPGRGGVHTRMTFPAAMVQFVPFSRAMFFTMKLPGKPV